MERPPRLAVLIDADNVSASRLVPLLEEIAKFGVATVRRIYGDWTSTQLGSWKDALLEHSIQPMQQFPNTKGKNSTDSALIIDAMDLLHAGRLDGFCLVSSDSDFTALAQRIRAHGLPVYGFGESKTPKPFVSACTLFRYTDVLSAASDSSTKSTPLMNLKGDTRLVNLLRNAVEASADDSGWASLGEVGSRLTKQEPDFDSRNYGFARLRQLVEEIGLFDIDERSGPQGHKHLWLRDKRKRSEAKKPDTDKADKK